SPLTRRKRIIAVAPSASRSSPSAPSTTCASSLRNSPHTVWWGPRERSSTTTRHPLRASSSANAAPASPPPPTTAGSDSRLVAARLAAAQLQQAPRIALRMQLLEPALEQDQQGCNLGQAEAVAEHALAVGRADPRSSSSVLRRE